MAHSLNAAPPRRLSSPKVKHLRAPSARRLDPRADIRLKSPVARKLPRAGGEFLPGFSGLGLVEDLDSTEVQVGYSDGDALAGSSMLPGVGALDFGALFSGKNLGLMAVAVGAGYLLFKK